MSKRNRSWDEFIESNGFLDFCHYQFDCPEECGRHPQPGRVSILPVRNPVSNPNGHVSPSVCNESVPAPVSGPGTPVPSKRMRKYLNLSSVTPKCNVDTCKQIGTRPNAKVIGRFTRSMVAKGSTIKPSVNRNINIETVVLDDEEEKTVLPDNGFDIGHESIPNPADKSPHMPDKNLQVDPMVDPPAKDKSVEANLPGFYRIGEMVHPLFVNCFLDKIHRMEEEIIAMVAHRDAMEVENARMKEKSDSDDKCLLRLKKHKNRLIQRVLKLQNENHKSEEKVCELNAQVTLMQFKGHSQNPVNGVNIHVFNAPVKL